MKGGNKYSYSSQYNIDDVRYWQEFLSYNSDTGIFTYLKRTNLKDRTGEVVGSKNKFGYLGMMHKKKAYLLHRLAWFFVHGVWPKQALDHINGIKDYNAISNLRIANPKENSRNRGANKKSKTGVKGVYYTNNKLNLYVVRININNKQRYLGYYPTLEEAKSVYVKSAKENHGEFLHSSLK